MRFLLDTQIFLWWNSEPEKISSKTRKQLSIPSTEVFVSVASIWEMSIKWGIGKLTLPSPPQSYIVERLESEDFAALPIDMRHACKVATLPWIHKDPFDRIIAAQCLVEDLSLITADKIFGRYGVKIAH